MSITTDLYDTLNANAGVRAIVGQATSPQHSKIYPVHAPESTAVPYIVFEIVTGERIHTLTGVDDQEREQIELRCTARTREGAHALADAVFDALEGNGRQDQKNEVYNFQSQTYTVTLDWIFHA